jgi:hypothetical protein
MITTHLYMFFFDQQEAGFPYASVRMRRKKQNVLLTM